MLTVSEVAELAGITVRTLHHYDKIGLLQPCHRSPKGYRLYTDEDLQRLQQILFWQALDFVLADVLALLDDPTFNRLDALLAQKGLLESRSKQLQEITQAVEAAIKEEKGAIQMTSKELFSPFDGSKYTEEVQSLWGDTPMYREAVNNAQTTRDEERWAAEEVSFCARLAAVKKSGASPDSVEATKLAEEARQAISQRFFECSHDMHRRLGELYVADDRFAQRYDVHADGLAIWYCQAIEANALAVPNTAD